MLLEVVKCCVPARWAGGQGSPWAAASTAALLRSMPTLPVNAWAGLAGCRCPRQHLKQPGVLSRTLNGVQETLGVATPPLIATVFDKEASLIVVGVATSFQMKNSCQFLVHVVSNCSGFGRRQSSPVFETGMVMPLYN